MYCNELVYQTVLERRRGSASQDAQGKIYGKEAYIPVRDGRQVRVLSYTPEGKDQAPLPVYFDVHGGGFIMGTP